MEVNTRFGRVDVDPDTILTFPNALPGFEGLTRFKLFQEEGNSSLFFLQSLDDPLVQFSLADPMKFWVHYQMTLSDEDIALLQLDDPTELRVLVMLSRAEQSKQAENNAIQANFLGPVVINTRSRFGLQKTLNQVEGFVTIVAE